MNNFRVEVPVWLDKGDLGTFEHKATALNVARQASQLTEQGLQARVWDVAAAMWIACYYGGVKEWEVGG